MKAGRCCVLLAVATFALGFAAGCGGEDESNEAKETKRRQREAAKELGVPVNKTIDLGGGVKLDLVLIPAGEFMMGSPANEKQRNSAEGPQHEVKITRPFYMGRTEVTQEQWEAVMGSNPSHFKGAKNPVEKVSWNDCAEFVKKLNARVNETGTFSLPTEAEWEYACRAGTSTPFHTGETISTDEANYNDRDRPRGRTTSVGSFAPNAFGLNDMHGNVWEWCSDRGGKYEVGPQTDPAGPSRGAGRVLRGGSWGLNSMFCRSANRFWFYPTARSYVYGVRVVLRDLQ